MHVYRKSTFLGKCQAMIKKTLKMMSKTIPTSMTNQCKIHARKSDAKHMENHPKMSSKGSQQPSQNLSKNDPKKTLKGSGPGHSQGPDRKSAAGAFSLSKDRLS